METTEYYSANAYRSEAGQHYPAIDQSRMTIRKLHTHARIFQLRGKNVGPIPRSESKGAPNEMADFEAFAREYERTAFSSNKVPDREEQTEEYNQGRFGRSVNARLPWGHTESTIPRMLFRVGSFERMEFLAGKRCPKLCERFDHVSIKEVVNFTVREFLKDMAVLSKWIFIISLPFIVAIPFMVRDGYSLDVFWDFYRNDLAIIYMCLVAPLAAWIFFNLLAVIVPSKLGGIAYYKPLWELDRTTGMVTVWTKIRSKLTSKFVSESHPFHHFDAWVEVGADKYSPRFRLVLFHRYKKLRIHLGRLIPKERQPHQSYALWDFVQNYMDVSQPLPDISVLESYRQLDPTTAEHDESVGRDGFYWRKMSRKEFDKISFEHAKASYKLDPLLRPDIMDKE